MEYEIGDDPQGQIDEPDGDRDGGLRENIVHRREAPAKPGLRSDDAQDEDSAPVQMGERG